MKGRSTNERGNQLTAASSFPTSVYSAANSVCIGSIGSVEGVSFGGVTREVAPCVCESVITLFALVAGVMARGIAPVKSPKGDPVAGARGSLVVVPETTEGFVPKRGPGTTLESSSAGASVLASGLDRRPDALGLIPPNGLGVLGVVVVAGLVVPSVGVVSGFGAVELIEKPIQPVVAAAPVAEEGLLLTGVPFVVNNGGVAGLGIIDGGGALTAWSTEDSSFVGGSGSGNLISAGEGEGALALPSHCPNGVFGDAGRGLSEAPLTSSSSPPDTGTFARGELRSGRVLGLLRPLLELELGEGDGDGEREGDGRGGVGS
jgi:hypothetical protein